MVLGAVLLAVGMLKPIQTVTDDTTLSAQLNASGANLFDVATAARLVVAQGYTVPSDLQTSIDLSIAGFAIIIAAIGLMLGYLLYRYATRHARSVARAEMYAEQRLASEPPEHGILGQGPEFGVNSGSGAAAGSALAQGEQAAADAQAQVEASSQLGAETVVRPVTAGVAKTKAATARVNTAARRTNGVARKTTGSAKTKVASKSKTVARTRPVAKARYANRSKASKKR